MNSEHSEGKRIDQTRPIRTENWNVEAQCALLNVDKSKQLGPMRRRSFRAFRLDDFKIGISFLNFERRSDLAKSELA